MFDDLQVDAALDLSHTQNIGYVLKNHFAKSQFLVVNLSPFFGFYKHARRAYWLSNQQKGLSYILVS